jgi:hypothetical protein
VTEGIVIDEIAALAVPALSAIPSQLLSFSQAEGVEASTLVGIRYAEKKVQIPSAFGTGIEEDAVAGGAHFIPGSVLVLFWSALLGGAAVVRASLLSARGGGRAAGGAQSRRAEMGGLRCISTRAGLERGA